MATKTTIQNLIDTNLASGSDITATEHRDVLTQILNENFPNYVTDTDTSETYTTKSGNNILYHITIIKQGNVAHIRLVITNAISSIISNQNIFFWKNSEFRPKSGGVNDFIFEALNHDGSSTRLLFNNNVVKLSGNMTANAVYTCEFKMYITQD